MLKPGWLDSVTETGLEVWHAGPTGRSIPATFRSAILIVIIDVVVTAPVLMSRVPVDGPSLRRSTVAVTGMSPSSVNEPVAGGSVRVALIAPVFRSAVALR